MASVNMATGPVVPASGGASLDSVVQAVLRRSTAPPKWLPSAVVGAEQVVLLVLDGLRWEQLQDRLALAPTLAAMAGMPITTVVPSTTATALTSLTTGAPPARCNVFANMGGGRAMRLQNKVAVITGAACGIGRASAELFAREGARVVLGDIADASEAVDRITDMGGQAIFVPTDVTDGDQVELLIATALGRWGCLDILFNNAGIDMAKPITEVSSSDFDRVFAVNVKGVYFGCKSALPHLIRQGSGSIINMSSTAGLAARADDPLYCAAKHAVLGLTKALALSYAYRGIRVNAICPGPIDTHHLADSNNGLAMDAILASCPAARFGLVDEVASVALFLASDECRFICGAGLAVDGAKSAGIMTADRYRLALLP